MAKTLEMSYIVEKDRVKVILPLTSRGKFRCKIRNDIQAFGNGFAPKSTIIPENAYLEWQIGYDTVIGKKEKNTRLKANSFTFTGANKKAKHPYELSEIAYFMCKNGLITKKEMKDVYNNIDRIKTFMRDKFTIETKKEDPLTLNNIKFLSSSTKLPTFITHLDDSKIMAEIMIEKQQYATDVQPMLYLIVPVKEFVNSNDIINHTSSETPNGILFFDATSKGIIFELLTCFGTCSESHNHDIKEIIKVIIDNAF